MISGKTGASNLKAEQWVKGLRKRSEHFIEKLKRIIFEENHIPDLAGVGNLLITRSGHIKLVDINNISRVFFDKAIHLDDMGYPVCDKSICDENHLYKTFLDPKRIMAVKAAERRFFTSMDTSVAPSELS